MLLIYSFQFRSAFVLDHAQPATPTVTDNFRHRHISVTENLLVLIIVLIDGS